MGINTHYYTVYGIKISSYDDDLSDAMYGEGDLYETVEKNENLDIIMDGMGGDYMVIGKILFDSGDLRWSEIKDTFVEIDMSNLTDIRLSAMQEMQKLFPDFSHYLDGDWKIMTFMHLS
jgi:hypothetical protein